MSAFIRVVPDEVEQHGPAAAIVLAHIRFRCGSDGPARFERDGYRWWRVSHADFGSEVGMSAKAVRGALNALSGVVTAKHFPPLSNQARAYRITESSEPVTSQKTERADADQPVDRTGIPDAPQGNSSRPNGHLQMPHRASALPIETLEKGGEAAGSRLAAAPSRPTSPETANSKPTYHPRCPDHRHAARPPACDGCRRAREADQAEAVAAEERRKARNRAIRAAIDNCPNKCDEYGRDALDASKDCLLHPNFRSTSLPVA